MPTNFPQGWRIDGKNCCIRLLPKEYHNNNNSMSLWNGGWNIIKCKMLNIYLKLSWLTQIYIPI